VLRNGNNATVRRHTLTLLVVAGVLALPACGGGSAETVTSGEAKGVDADQYTGSVCGELSAWKQQLASASASLMQQTNDPKMSLAEVRTRFVTFYGGALAETNTMLAEVRAIGVPDVNRGQQVATSLQQSLRRFRTLLLDATARARRLPVDNEVNFTKQAQQLGTGFEMESTGLPRLWDYLAEHFEAPELLTAASAHASCTTL